MKSIRIAFFWISITATCVCAETVYYTLDNVILDDGSRITGLFSWVYSPGDFENGASQFLSLDIPHSSHNQDDLTSTIETAQIEITFDGNVHDDGVDIKIVLLDPLTRTAPSLINVSTNESKYSIGGNGFHDGFFLGGSIVPTDIVLSMEPVSSGVVSVSWEPEVPGLVLQETTSLLDTNWVSSASGTTNPAAVSVTAPATFYRLVMP